MKKLSVFLFCLAFSLSACTTRTQYGDCVGVFDEKNPALTYKLSAWNLAMAILFFEVIIPPVVVVVDETFCPVSKK